MNGGSAEGETFLKQVGLQKRRSSPFRRVKSDVNTEHFGGADSRIYDNSYNAFRDGMGDGDWGDKAASDFKTVKGKNFRHEKTKKKRGSYRGGKISTGINSIKFE
jgi:nucleolin